MKNVAERESFAVSEPDKPQRPKDNIPREVSATSGLGRHENGIRVSVTAQEVETEVSIKRIFGEANDDVSYADKEEDTSGSVMKENEEELDSVLGNSNNEEHGVEKMSVKKDSVELSGDDSYRKAECHDNGISLVVEVHGSSPSEEGHPSKIDTKRSQNLGKKSRAGDKTSSFCDNKGTPGERIRDMDGSSPDQKRDINGKAEEDGGDGEYEYSVGDFVWGKIKSHPWWPGQIYDPKDASTHAVKYSQRDRLLVAYFGDDTFAWCYPSQLKPFEENFKEMSMQSNSRSFVNALEEAVAEIGRHVESRMTCSCTPKELKSTPPLSVNAGIKEGALVPEGGIGKFAVAHFDPAEFLLGLKCVAQVVSVTSKLDLTVLKSRLLAFCRSKGVYQLAAYHEPQEIAGLEDKVGNVVTDICDLDGPVEVPIQGPFEDDWLSVPVSPGFAKTSQTILHKSAGLEDKLYQRRKQKSMAEIMKGERVDVEHKNEEGFPGKEGICKVKLGTAPVRKRRRKGSNEAESHGVNSLTSPRGRRKKAKLLESPVTSEDRASSVESDGSEGKGESENSPVSRGRKTIENNGSRRPEEIYQGSVSRERKKSKYLCPPYTNVIRMQRSFGSKSDTKMEFDEASGVDHSGERVQLVDSPPVLEYSSETFQKKDSKDLPQIPKQNWNKMIDVKKLSIKEVLSGIRIAALNQQYMKESKSLDKINGFLYAFRSTKFHDGSNYKMFNKSRPGRKRKSQESGPELFGGDVKENEHNSSKLEPVKRRNVTKEPDGPELKQAANCLDMKSKHSEKDKKVESATLLLSFGAGISLPSKEDLVKIFSKFGALNESETEILYDTFCARVVFLRSSDAEEAFNSSQKTSPFGAAEVSYRLRYPSLPTASRTRELSEISDPKPSPPIRKAYKTTDNPYDSVGEKSQLSFIKQKLEKMTSMLEKSNGKLSQEMKSNLEGEMKGLLEKVSTMAETS